MIERIKNCETRQFKVIFPNTLNDNNTLFGGTAMQWMDEVAYITAVRYVKKKMVTVSTEKIRFLNPIESGTIVEIVGKIVNVRKVKIEIQVEIFVENLYSENKQKSIDALFVFAAVNEKNKPIPIGN